MKTIVALLLVSALVLTSAGVLLTSLDAQEWLPTVVLAALAYLGTFALYRRLRGRWSEPED